MLTSRQLHRYDQELASIDGTIARQQWLLNLINKNTGSDFSAINLTDDVGRVLGGMAFPMTPRRIQQITKYAPTLNAVLTASPLHAQVWNHGPNRAYACPQPLFRSSPEYQSVYRHMGMHYMAFFLYPAANGRRVVLGISSARRGFSASQLRALEKICLRFSKDIIDVAPSGVPYSKHPVKSDHTATLDADLKPKAVSEYLHAMLAFFYGALPLAKDGSPMLPEGLLAEIQRCLRTRIPSVMPLEGGTSFALSKRRQGRALCTVLILSGETKELWCYEDFSQLDYLGRVRLACRSLRRDQFAILSACLAIIDGAKGEREILKRACLSALKPSSGRRIVSAAKRILDSA